MSHPARREFLQAATWHGSLDEAERLLRAHPELATLDIFTTAVLGDDVTVRRLLAEDPGRVHTRSEPHGADPLNYLCLSRYLRLHPDRSDGFLRAAAALLDAGADPDTGFWTDGPHRERETALYGAAGVAHHEPLTRLLLARGADPNDVEAVYHSPEGSESGAMIALVETGRITPDHLSLMLVRKHDWHDFHGLKYLLEHGADPNHPRSRGTLPIHQGIARDNGSDMIELELDHGADPLIVQDGITAIERAALRGRGDLLALFEKRGFDVRLAGTYRLIAACARGDGDLVRSIAASQPRLVDELLNQGGARLSEFAGTWNTEGVALLLDLGVPVDARYGGDGYFDLAADTTALHEAAWKGVPSTVRLLIGRGAPVNASDAKGRTPLMLAVRATVDSYWTERRTPHSVRALLEAGASLDGVKYPSGYDEVDELLRKSGARPGATGRSPG